MSEQEHFEPAIKVEGSVFEFLGFEDAAEMDLKAQLVHQVRKVRKERGLTQEALGKMIGMHQSEVSRMLNNHLDEFSIDRLIKVVEALGFRPQVSVTFMEMSAPTQAT